MKNLTIHEAQTRQPWTVPYSSDVLFAHGNGKGDVPHILASHCVLHAAKTVGKLAAVFEDLDHTGSAQPNTWQLQVIKDMSADLLVEAMRFANLYGFDLATELQRRVKDKNGKGYE